MGNQATLMFGRSHYVKFGPARAVSTNSFHGYDQNATAFSGVLLVACRERDVHAYSLTRSRFDGLWLTRSNARIQCFVDRNQGHSRLVP